MFSILTPTYNRAHTLVRVFKSLVEQTEQDFEWIIMDDASTDQTKRLVQEWQNSTTAFTIHYHELHKNKGKPNAINIGLDYCSQPITVIADSDDSFALHTIADL